MRERIGQPKNMPKSAEEALAVLGHRIERWDMLADSRISPEMRKQALLFDIRSEIQALRAQEDSANDVAVSEEIQELVLDAEDVANLDLSEGSFDALRANRKAFYSDVRDEILGSL